MSTHYKTSQELPLHDLVFGLARHKQKAIAEARTLHDTYDMADIMLVQLVSVSERNKRILVFQERSMMKEYEQMNGQDVSGEEWNSDNYLHIHMNDEKTEVTGFTRYGMNHVDNIVRVIEIETGVQLISEHEEDEYYEKEDV
jgi:hypothetical protein